ncbi:hypothetical protein ANANG_G00163670 [Anguilla anguilla]|uniref:Nuclear factor related to kappa-B-binding protein second winged helix domain-containing protein n=1 Tax=Anguilla anguilla TaxID=7936 RepID=A0A9D3M8T3_ANGAN|nr:hypothetical protein ANANG_G00163670 [Anguilla anguilla]
MDQPRAGREKDLSELCQLWLESKDQVVVKQESEEPAELTPPTPRVWTDYVVRPSTGEERHVFQEQEQQRYDQPHKAFTFRMHGFESVVGPVKGVFDKETSLNKAREHSLLRSDRPAYVTILSLVRDAAARLPNGEGTRAEICELLKDSQFLAPDVTSAQVNTVVSGALDRLHYEKDPCVKYDIGRKLWIYLHRNRSQEEFERIHQAQAAAAKAKKALQQKPKPALKPKSSSKEGGGKTPGACEPGQIVMGDGSAMPTATLPATPTTPTVSTPGTPKSPLAPAAGTPTKTGVPDPMKPSPSVLLVSPPSMPQLGTLLSASQSAPQAPQPASAQPGARVLAHPGAGSLPQVRVVTAQPGLAPSPGTQQATLVHQASHQIRVPVTVAHTKGITQTVVTLPLRTQSGSSPCRCRLPELRPASPSRAWRPPSPWPSPRPAPPAAPPTTPPPPPCSRASPARASSSRWPSLGSWGSSPRGRGHPADRHQPAHPGQGRAPPAPVLHHHGRQGADGAAHHARHDGHAHQVARHHRQAHARHAERRHRGRQRHLRHPARHPVPPVLALLLLLPRPAGPGDLKAGASWPRRAGPPGEGGRGRRLHPADARPGGDHGRPEGPPLLGGHCVRLQAGRHHPHHARPGRHPAQAGPGHHRDDRRRRQVGLRRDRRHHSDQRHGGGQGPDHRARHLGLGPLLGGGHRHCPPGSRYCDGGVHSAG